MNRNIGLLTVILGLVVFSGLIAAVRPMQLLAPSAAQTLRK